MKLLTPILLVAFLFINQISVQASTSDIKQISIDNIEEIIIEHSPEFKIIENNLKKYEENYDDLIEDCDDKEDEVNKLENQKSAAKEQEKNKSSADKKGEQKEECKCSTDKKTEPTEYDKLNAKLEEEKKNLKALKVKKRDARYELRTYKIQHEKELQALVESAQKQYIGYVDTLLKKQLKHAETDLKNKEVEINNFKYSSGFISKKEYEKNLDDIKDFNDDEEKLVVEEKNQLKDLLFSLGIKDKSDIKFNIDINFDVDKILKIDYKDDLDEMLLNNVDLKIKDIEMDKQEDLDDVSDYDIKNNKIELKQKEEKAKLEFEKNYNNLILSSNLIKSQNDKLSRTNDDALIMQTKYNYGFASKKQLDQLEIDLNNKNQDFIAQVNKLYMDYLSYMKMKDGY